MPAKDCTKCNIIKPLTDFNKRKNGLGGKDSRCRACYNAQSKDKKAEYDKKYRAQNKDEILKKGRGRHHANREHANEKRRQHYLINRDHHLEKMKNWREENKDYIRGYNREKMRKYRESHPEYVIQERLRRKEHYRLNREVYADRWKRYYSENKESLRKRGRDRYHLNKKYYQTKWRNYYQTPKGQLASRRASHKRRASECGVAHTLTTEQWDSALDYFDNRCAYCGEDGKMTQDHFVPVSKGGDYADGNIVPACGPCNYSKRDRNFSDWFKRQSFYDSERADAIMSFTDASQSEDIAQ